MKATIKNYRVNATLFVDGENYDINWDGMEFDNPAEYKEWVDEQLEAAEECENYDEVRRSLEAATDHLRPDHKVEDVELTKAGYGHDTLTWVLDGEEQSCTGEFYVDKEGMLHHTAIAANGDEVEITIKY